MILAEEITDWDSLADYNHTYYLNDSKNKCYGYWKWHVGEYIEFSKPLSFDKRRRQFLYTKDLYWDIEHEDLS